MKNRHKIWILLFIPLFAIILRFLLAKDYFPHIDSHFYLENFIRNSPVDTTLYSTFLNIGGLYFSSFYQMLILYVSIVAFSLIPKNFKERVLTSLFVSFSPLIFMNTKFFLFDKNIFSIVFIMFVLFFYLQNKRFSAYIYAVLLIFFWKGGVVLIGILLLLDTIMFILKRQNTVYTIIIGLICLIIAQLFFSIPKSSFAMMFNKHLIAETRFLWETFPYLEYALIIIVTVWVITDIIIDIYDKIYFNDHRIILYSYFFITLLMSIYMFRFLIFLLPAMYLILACLMFKYDIIKYPLAIIVLIFLLSYPVYTEGYIMNDDIKNASLYINTLPKDCVITDWSKGHIYNFYLNSPVKYSASASHINEQLDILVYGNVTSDCIFVWDSSDIQAMNYSLQLLNRTVPETFYIETIPYIVKGQVYIGGEQ